MTSQEDKKTWKLYKDKYLSEFVDVVFVPYSEIELFSYDPLAYSINSGYLS